jgi:hypothetical protein
MAAQDPTSKRQSAANSGSMPSDPSLVFFVDRSLGQKVIAEKLRENGLKVEIHDDHFPQDALDEHWIAEVAAGRFILAHRSRAARAEPARRDLQPRT